MGVDFDSIDNTYDYVEIVKCVRQVFDSHRYNLLEELASCIAGAIITKCTDDYPIQNLVVNVKKYNPEGMDIPYVEVGYEVSL